MADVSIAKRHSLCCGRRGCRRRALPPSRVRRRDDRTGRREKGRTSLATLFGQPGASCVQPEPQTRRLGELLHGRFHGPRPARATGARRAPITEGSGKLHAWPTCAGRGRRRFGTGATGVREARPLCPGPASGGTGKPGDVLCGHRRRVAGRTAQVRARRARRVSRLWRHATRLRSPGVRRLRAASTGRLHVRRARLLSHVLGPPDEPDDIEPAHARRTSATTPAMGADLALWPAGATCIRYRTDECRRAGV
jgi:hypothetical protein